MTSGLLLNEDIFWVSFHGVYDFAYLLKIITGLPLPETEIFFFENMKLYFPHYYDIRYLVRYTENFRCSLNKLGQELNINRIGAQHQAGSDSIITSEIFCKLKSEIYSEEDIRGDKNILFGLGSNNEDNDYSFLNTVYYNNSNSIGNKNVSLTNMNILNPTSNYLNSAFTSNINEYIPNNFYNQGVQGIQGVMQQGGQGINNQHAYNFMQRTAHINGGYFPSSGLNVGVGNINTNLNGFMFNYNNMNNMNNFSNGNDTKKM